jgi:C4-dicarboxylate-specific signal transduction histidine kinase
MAKNYNRKPGIIIALVAAAFAIFLTFFMFGYLMFTQKKNASQQSRELAALSASSVAVSVSNNFNNAYLLTRNYASDLLVAEKNNLPRSLVFEMLKGSLESNVNFLAVWTIFEADSEFRGYEGNKPKKEHKPGLFGISYRLNAELTTQEIIDSTAYNQDYYTIPKKTGRPVVLEPYTYNYFGVPGEFFETSFVSPIIDENRFIGVVGVDIDLSEIQKQYSGVRIMKEGYLSIIAHSGHIVTNPNHSFINRRFFSFCGNDSLKIIENFRKGEEFETEGFSEFTGKRSLRYFHPVRFENISTSWYVMAEIPVSEIMKEARKLSFSSVFYLMASLIILVYMIHNISERRRSEKRMEKDIEDLKQAGGELMHLKENLEIIAGERTLFNTQLNHKLAAANMELNNLNEALFNQKTALEESLAMLNEAQEKMISSEKLASLGVLASGVAHEINNPLNYIQGGVTGIEEYFIDNLPEHIENIRPLIHAMRSGLERSSGIVKSLSHYSRSGKSSNANCNLIFVLENCLTILQSDLRTRAEIKRYYPENACIICGNESSLHQLFLNILSNAAQAIGQDGIISISVVNIKPGYRVIVEDNGHGIEKDYIDKVFDPFFTTREPGAGVGLGLSIAQKIAREHRGDINIESEEGKGTRVNITLQGGEDEKK